MKRPNQWNNPWNLTPRQCDVLSALTKAYCDKRAADLLGIQTGSVALQMTRAKKRMNASCRMQAVLMWDRHMRECIEAQMVRA